MRGGCGCRGRQVGDRSGGGGARTEYFNFLRGCTGAVGAEQFTRTVWLACLLGGESGVSLDGSPPTSTPPLSTLWSPPVARHHHHHHHRLSLSDCEQTGCDQCRSNPSPRLILYPFLLTPSPMHSSKIS